MRQAKTIPELQSYISSAQSSVQQNGTAMLAEEKRMEQLYAEFREAERERDALEEENDSLREEIEDLQDQLESLNDDNDEDGSRAAEIQRQIAACRAEMRENSRAIQPLERQMSQAMQAIQIAQRRIKQYAEFLGGCRQALLGVDQMLVGHIEERSLANSGMEQLGRMNYSTASAGPRASKLAQDVQDCERERQKVAQLQAEITGYLGDGVNISAAAAQKGTISGHGGAGRPASAAVQTPGAAPPAAAGPPDNGPSHIETAKTVSAAAAPPQMVSMAPPGGKPQADVSDIRQMAQANRGKWADAAGFICAGAAAAGMAAQDAENAPAKEESPLQKRVNELHEQYDRMEKMRSTVDSFDESDDKAVMLNRIAEDFAWKAKEMDAERAPLDEQYQQLMKRYGELANRPETKETRELQHQISKKMLEVDAARKTLKSDSEYFQMHVNAIRRNYPIKTKFVGVRGKQMSECMLSMIPQQGLVVENFKGTCGCCCIAEAIELLGGSATEAEIIEFARAHKLCTDKKIKDSYSAEKRARIVGDNGGTTMDEREKILEELGYQCEYDFKGSLNNIYQQLQTGKVAMIAIDHHVLKKKSEQKHSLFSVSSADHAVIVTGVELDENGEPAGIWIHDTGNCSYMGTEFYCSKQDFKKWMKAAGSVVQYVS